MAKLYRHFLSSITLIVTNKACVLLLAKSPGNLLESSGNLLETSSS